MEAAAAAEANGLLRLIGYSESFCMCNPKINPPSDAFPFLAAHKKIKGKFSTHPQNIWVSVADVTAQAERTEYRL